MIVLPEFHNILLFASAATLLIIIPGPAVLYIMARSMEQGTKAGIVSVLGIGVGGLVHVFAAGIGISAILVASATAFSVLKYLGAIYLIYLGIRKIREKPSLQHPQPVSKKRSLSAIFYEGVLVNIFNPKTAIFFFAFLPQFVSPERGGMVSQLLFLGFMFIAIAILSDSLYAVLSGRLASWIRNSPIYLKVHNYVIGTIYIVLGLLTLAVNQPNNTRRK